MKNVLLLVLACALCCALVVTGCKDDDNPVVVPAEDCSITVTAPVAATQYYTTTNNGVNIRWTKSGSDALVKIELLKSGAVVGNIADNTENDLFHFWLASTMGVASGTDFSIRVSAVGESDCNDQSSEFSIIDTGGCYFDVETPQLGLSADNPSTINWDSANTTGRVNIELLYRDNPVGVIAYGAENTQQFVWDVHTFNEGSNSRYVYRVTDFASETCLGTSGEFSISDPDICQILVTSPALGVSWTEGETRAIGFVDENMDGELVDIFLYRAGELTGIIAEDVVASESRYDWVVTDFRSNEASTGYRVVIISVSDNYCEAKSETFAIVSTD